MSLFVKSSKKAQQSLKQRPRFWLGPLVAGCCFALSYGIANRLLLLSSQGRSLQNKSFEEKAFPGIELHALRNLHGGKRLELLPRHDLKEAQEPIRGSLDTAKSKQLGDLPQKIVSEGFLRESTQYEPEQALVNHAANSLKTLPLIPWIPQFPSRRTIPIPQDLPQVF